MSDDVPPREPTSRLPTDPPRPGVAPDLLSRFKGAPVTIALLAVNVVVFLFAEAHGRTTETETLLRFGADERLHVRMGEVWRLGSSMFLHIGWVHLLWNGYCSFGWCAPLEREMGRWRFLVLYLASGVGGGVASVLAHQVVAAGASGALFGVIGGRIVSRRNALGSWSAVPRDPASRSMIVGMAIWTALGMTAVSMDNFAHGGGLVTGLAVASALTSAPRNQARRAAVVGAALVAFGVLAVRPGWEPDKEEARRLAQFAYFYAKPETGEPDDARAARFAKRACDAGDVEGCGVYGWLVYLGRGTPEDRAGGMQRIREACARGSGAACAMVSDGKPSP